MSSGNKFARATGRGQFRPPPNRGLVPLRPGQAPSKRTPLGHGKDVIGSTSAGNGGIANISREESFQLMPHPDTIGPPFAMVIRLQPEILEELKQAEADGIEPEMKFGTNAVGHVIQVGSETFKFQSAPEPGHLCDIYEQRKGDSGEVVLVEAGSAWRKLSVLRILSATEKDRVKKRTAEAEKKQRQRKSILVDPSTQIIIPQAATAEANGRKPLPKLTKEPPPKKRKVTMSPIKQNTHTSSTVVTGNHQFSSPASPSFEPPAIQVRGSHVTQMADMHPSKGRAVPERIGAPLANKGPAIQKDKSRTPAAPTAPDSGKSGLATNMTDLRNFLIGLMQENPKGVTIKAIEKAVAEGLPTIPEKKVLDKVMKTIASFHAPGKYLLNPGVEKGKFFDPVPPTSSGRAQEAVRSSIHEDEPSISIPEREAAKEEPTSFDRGLSNVLTHHSEHSTKEASPELVGAQLFDSSILHDNLSKQDAAHVSKDRSSESSSSSGSGSASDSDTDSSGSGSGTDSGSGSGSDSASSSSSGASMDEDVDIMSDDDVEKKSDAKQKAKVRESKSAKEDVKVQEKSNFKEEGHKNSIPLNRSEPVPTLDQAKDRGPDARGKVSENLIDSVFGQDEVSDFAHDNLGERVRGEQSSHIKSANVNYRERKTSSKTQNGRESRERNTFDEGQRSATRDSDALGLEEELDLLVDKVSELKEMDNGSLVGNRVGFSSAQQEHHKLPLKSVGLGITKDIDKKRADAECISRPNLDRRECDVYDDRWASKNPSSSLEISKMLPEGSPMELGDHLQNVAKAPPENLSQKQQASAEAKRATSKKLNARESHEKFERAKASEIVVKSKSPSNITRASHGTANASEGAMKLDDERGIPVDRISDKGAETSDLLEVKHKKERGAEERMPDGAKFGDISGMQSRHFETQHWQQKDGSAHLGASKLNLHRVSKESNHTGGGHDRDSPHADKSNKVLKLSRQKGESLERAVEQAERPLTDIESTKRGKDISGKGTLKESESGGRISSGEPSNLLTKEAARFGTVYGDSGHSSYSHGRNQTRENSRIVSQVAELRDPPFENGSFFESRKWPPHMESSRTKATSGATSRVLHKGSLSPDQDDLQDVDRRPLDMSKQSPVKATNDSRHYAYDSSSGKRRPEEIESAETERSKKIAGAAHIKQPPQKEELFPTGSVKQNHTEKGRFSASDSQEYASVRSDEEMEELYRQQKVSQTLSEFRRDHFKAGDSLDNTKRPTPQSNDEVCEFFAPYEKKKPELRGLINTFQEYKEYCKEYHEKYQIYIQLNGAIEQHKKPFETFKKDIERAKFKDDEKKLAHTRGKVRKEYTLHHKNRKRMFHTFRILHEELKAIKTKCKEYAEKVGERMSVNNPKYTPLS